MKRVIALLFVFLISALIFTGCSNDDNGNVSNNSEVEIGQISKDDVRFLDANGESVYQLVYDENDGKDSKTCTNYVYMQMKKTLGINAKKVLTDNESVDFEILIGSTNRPESNQALKYLNSKTGGRYDEYIICTIGKKIVINAYSVDGLDAACEYFVKNYVKKDGVDGGIEYCYAVEGNYSLYTINGVVIRDFNIVYPEYNSSYLTCNEITNLRNMVYEKTGYFPDEVYDSTDVTDYEIIVGNSKRDGISTITGTDDFEIKVSGKKVYLNGGSAHATAMAVSEFSKMLQQGNVTDCTVTNKYSSLIASYDCCTTLAYVWGDDFNSDRIDGEFWNLIDEDDETNKGVNGKTSLRSSNPDDVFVKDGKFHICARQDENYYYGGKITTKKKVAFLYGYSEISALLPQGTGFWIAFWINDASFISDRVDPDRQPYYHPEVDIMEMFGNSSYYAANMHSWPSLQFRNMQGFVHKSLDTEELENDKKRICTNNNKFNDTFHTFGMLWDDQSMAFMCDGTEFFRYVYANDQYDAETFRRHVDYTISMATGFETSTDSKITDKEEEWANSNKFIVDYCNLYQLGDGKSSIVYGDVGEYEKR